jgi:bacterioferritin
MPTKKKNPLIDALNEAIAEELTAITQYMWHHTMAQGMESQSVREIFRKASIEEMKHAEVLAERLDYLGGVPTTRPNEIKMGGNLQKMIRDNLNLENEAIVMYKRIIKMCGDDSTTRRMLEEILADEEEHASTFESLLSIQK